MLSKYCSEIAYKYEIKVGGANLLVPNLRNKEKDVVYYRNIQLYLSLGMRLTRIHRILNVRQSDWLKKYIEFNTEKRKNTVTSYEKIFFKKKIRNCVYGKTIENQRKIIAVKRINNSKDYVRCVSKPNFISPKIFSQNFVAVYQIKPVLTLNKPIYVGFTTLELSKLLMYKFHYEYVKNKLDVKLLFSDTGSLEYEIKEKDVYEKCFKNRELFVFSDYPVSSKFYDISNKRFLGKMKDEFKGEVFSEFIGLKNKMYSLATVKDQEVVSKAKGVN